MTIEMVVKAERSLPNWVPDAAKNYIAHTEYGESLRAVARRQNCHPSTVLRQVRKLEQRRDDPLVDAALRGLGECGNFEEGVDQSKDKSDMVNPLKSAANPVSEERLMKDAYRVLQVLARPGAVLAIAAEMQKAVVVQGSDATDNFGKQVVERDVAEAMALKDWIACSTTGRVSKYRITPAGRSLLNQLTAKRENKVRGFAESQAGFDTRRARSIDLPDAFQAGLERNGRFVLPESPLAALSRRRDKGGDPYLKDFHVRAGERLREDFELAKATVPDRAEWSELEASGFKAFLAFPGEDDAGKGAVVAKGRLIAALEDLGPELSEIALRCCCLLEGLETSERQMGFAARSGKVVLRIALMRLHRHYDREAFNGGDLIG